MPGTTSNFNIPFPILGDDADITSIKTMADFIDALLNTGFVQQVVGKVLSSNDFTDEEKAKLAGIAENANNFQYPSTRAASAVSLLDSAGHFTSSNAEGAFAELFQSVSNGKGTVETAITDKGGTVTKTGTVATFPELVAGVNSISGGVSFQLVQINAGSGTRDINLSTPVDDVNKSIIYVNTQLYSDDVSLSFVDADTIRVEGVVPVSMAAMVLEFPNAKSTHFVGNIAAGRTDAGTISVNIGATVDRTKSIVLGNVHNQIDANSRNCVLFSQPNTDTTIYMWQGVNGFQILRGWAWVIEFE